MKTVWKFPFDILPEQTLQIPRSAVPLMVALDPHGKPSLWCKLDSGQEVREFPLYVIATGDKLEIDAPTYLGSFVWKINNNEYHAFTK